FNEGAGTSSGSPVRVRNSSLHITGSGASSFLLLGNSSSLSGDLAAAQTVSLTVECGSEAIATAAGSFTNAGTIVLGSDPDGCFGTSRLTLSSGTLTNTGTIDVEVGDNH